MSPPRLSRISRAKKIGRDRYASPPIFFALWKGLLPMLHLRSGVDWFIDDGGVLTVYPTFGQLQYKISSNQFIYSYFLRRLELGIPSSLLDGNSSAISKDSMIISFINSLRSRNLVVDRKESSSHLDDKQLELYSRQIAVFEQAGNLPFDPIEAQEVLASSHACIIGCGGVGAPIAEMLAASGVGFLTVIDGDNVELSNLGRQISYSFKDIHKNKALSLSRRIQQINPSCNVTCQPFFLTASNAPTLLEGKDIIVVAADSPMPNLLDWIDEACKQSSLNTPYIVASNSWPTIRVGPLFFPWLKQSYSDYRKSLRLRWPQADIYERDCSNSATSKGTTVCACYATAALTANMIINYLINSPSVLPGCSFLLDINTMQGKATPLLDGGAPL